MQCNKSVAGLAVVAFVNTVAAGIANPFITTKTITSCTTTLPAKTVVSCTATLPATTIKSCTASTTLTPSTITLPGPTTTVTVTPATVTVPVRTVTAPVITLPALTVTVTSPVSPLTPTVTTVFVTITSPGGLQGMTITQIVQGSGCSTSNSPLSSSVSTHWTTSYSSFIVTTPSIQSPPASTSSPPSHSPSITISLTSISTSPSTSTSNLPCETGSFVQSTNGTVYDQLTTINYYGYNSKLAKVTSSMQACLDYCDSLGSAQCLAISWIKSGQTAQNCYVTTSLVHDYFSSGVDGYGAIKNPNTRSCSGVGANQEASISNKCDPSSYATSSSGVVYDQLSTTNKFIMGDMTIVALNLQTCLDYCETIGGGGCVAVSWIQSGPNALVCYTALDAYTVTPFAKGQIGISVARNPGATICAGLGTSINATSSSNYTTPFSVQLSGRVSSPLNANGTYLTVASMYAYGYPPVYDQLSFNTTKPTHMFTLVTNGNNALYQIAGDVIAVSYRTAQNGFSKLMAYGSAGGATDIPSWIWNSSLNTLTATDNVGVVMYVMTDGAGHIGLSYLPAVPYMFNLNMTVIPG